MKEYQKETTLRRCPLCKGFGKIVDQRGNYSEKIREKARKLYAKGVRLREIGRRLDIDHPQKVKSLIMSKIW